MRTILRAVGLLKTIVKVTFDKKDYKLLGLQRHERFVDSHHHQDEVNEGNSHTELSDVVYYR